MKLRGYIVCLLTVGAVTTAIGLSGLALAANDQYVPKLGDIMNAVQSRHMKLWFAGKAKNWGLADYELRELQAGLVEAAVLYEGIPVSNVTTMAKPVQSIADAIKAKDTKLFAKGVGELTDGCNACHQSMQRGFIAIRVPTEQPFSNQVFAPRGKP